MILVECEKYITIKITRKELNNLNALIYQMLGYFQKTDIDLYNKLFKDLEKPLNEIKAILNSTAYD